MSAITLETAETIVTAALQARRRHGFAAFTVVVLDPGGHLVLLKREDNSGILRADIAVGKAWGALGMGLASREIAARAAKVPAFYQSLQAVSQGRLVPAPGGVLLYDKTGALLGAVGISGDNGDNDEICALAGVEAAGLSANQSAATAAQ